MVTKLGGNITVFHFFYFCLNWTIPFEPQSYWQYIPGNRAKFFRNFNFAKRKRFTRNEMLMMRTGSLCTHCNMVFCLENRGKMVLQNGLTASPSWQQITAPLSFEKQRLTFGHQRSTYL